MSIRYRFIGGPHDGSTVDESSVGFEAGLFMIVNDLTEGGKSAAILETASLPVMNALRADPEALTEESLRKAMHHAYVTAKWIEEGEDTVVLMQYHDTVPGDS